MNSPDGGIEHLQADSDIWRKTHRPFTVDPRSIRTNAISTIRKDARDRNGTIFAISNMISRTTPTAAMMTAVQNIFFVGGLSFIASAPP
jgi:hypothetical protein